MTKFVVLDTNALPTKGAFESIFWKSLFRVCAIRGLQLAVCEVTLHEAVNMRRESADKWISQFLSAHTRLSELTHMEPVFDPGGEAVAAEHEGVLRKLFTILPLDGEHAREALRREALRIAPAGSGKGGRDAGIWLTVSQLANNGHEVHFVTDNHRDFGKDELRSELLADIDGAPGSIVYHRSPNDILDQNATRISVPDPAPFDVASAFSESIRSNAVILIEDDSVLFSADRVWDAVLTVRDATLGQAYEVDGQGLVYVRAMVSFSNPSGVEWAYAPFDGWMNFEAATFEEQPSEVDSMGPLTERFVLVG